ncbi:MAG: 23S rRNA (guanosine(2251)-2'-O)-methyltransferase RlmB [Actinomycetota bacterium]
MRGGRDAVAVRQAVTGARRSSGPPGEGWPLGGRRAAAEAVRSGRARRLLVSRDARRTQGLRSVLAEAERSRVPVEWLGGDAIDRLSIPDHQGVAVYVSPPPELSERDLAALDLGPDAVVVVLDGITDPQNFGACARSAEAAGAAALVVRRRRAAPVTPAAIRASAGALLHLPVARVTNIARTIGQLQVRGFTAVGLDAEGKPVQDAPPRSGPCVLVVGSEGTGLSRLVRERCDFLIAIPMRGQTASLNASAALAVGLFAYGLRS